MVVPHHKSLMTSSIKISDDLFQNRYSGFRYIFGVLQKSTDESKYCKITDGRFRFKKSVTSFYSKSTGKRSAYILVFRSLTGSDADTGYQLLFFSFFFKEIIIIQN